MDPRRRRRDDYGSSPPARITRQSVPVMIHQCLVIDHLAGEEKDTDGGRRESCSQVDEWDDVPDVNQTVTVSSQKRFIWFTLSLSASPPSLCCCRYIGRLKVFANPQETLPRCDDLFTDQLCVRIMSRRTDRFNSIILKSMLNHPHFAFSWSFSSLWSGKWKSCRSLGLY